MTPTEQDKELREKLYSIFEIDCDYYSPTVQNGCGYDGFYCNLHTSMLDNAMQLITADRKRVVLEARIDALEYAKISPKFKIEERIGSLKQELESL